MLLFKERICSRREQILSFKSSPYGKEAKHFMVIILYYKYFLTNIMRMRNMRFERNVYGFSCLYKQIALSYSCTCLERNVLLVHLCPAVGLCEPCRLVSTCCFYLRYWTKSPIIIIIIIIIINPRLTVFLFISCTRKGNYDKRC